MEIVCITIMPDFKPGDPEPSGYLEWHEWAAVQEKAGIHQGYCGDCGKWKYPQVDCGHDKSKRLTQRQVNRMNKDAEKDFTGLRIAQLEAELKRLKKGRK